MRRSRRLRVNPTSESTAARRGLLPVGASRPNKKLQPTEGGRSAALGFIRAPPLPRDAGAQEGCQDITLRQAGRISKPAARTETWARHDAACSVCGRARRARALIWDRIGLLALMMAQGQPSLAADAWSAAPGPAEAERNAARSGLSAACAFSAGLVSLRPEAGEEKYDLIAANPPYFAEGSGVLPRAPARAAARYGGRCSFPELAAAAARLLRTGGRFCLCFRPERLTEILRTLSDAGLEPKRLRLAQADADSPPFLALAECRRGGRPGLSAEPALLLRGADGAETPQVRKMYHRE